MKRTTPFALSLLALSLSACSLNPINQILGISAAETPEAWLLNDGYAKFTDMDSLNKGLQKGIDDWYFYRGGNFAEYKTPHAGTVHTYDDGTIIFKSPFAENLSFERGYPVNRYTTQATRYEVEGGHVFITPNNWMVYVSADDYFDFYILEEGDTFLRKDNAKTYTIPTPELPQIEEAKEAREYAPFFKAVTPKGGVSSYGMFGKEFVSNKRKQGYEIFFPGVKASEYAEEFRKEGYYVFKADDPGIFGLNGEESPTWEIYDEESEYVGELIYKDPLTLYDATRLSVPENRGACLRVVSGLKTAGGTEVTEQTDWTAKDKGFMEEHYGAALPFVALGAQYRFSKTRSSNTNFENWMTVRLGGECYYIYDNYYRCLLDEYGAILLENGYVYHDLTNEQWRDASYYSSWKESDESFLYQCYVNEDLDIAVKIRYDRIYGNLIRVFKRSEMRAWDAEKDIEE